MNKFIQSLIILFLIINLSSSSSRNPYDSNQYGMPMTSQQQELARNITNGIIAFYYICVFIAIIISIYLTIRCYRKAQAAKKIRQQMQLKQIQYASSISGNFKNQPHLGQRQTHHI